MSNPEFTPIRSFLFTPANHPRRVEKVFEVGADAVILDLEDAVAVSEKPAARQCVVDAFSARPECVFVRGAVPCELSGVDQVLSKEK